MDYYTAVSVTTDQTISRIATLIQIPIPSVLEEYTIVANERGIDPYLGHPIRGYLEDSVGSTTNVGRELLPSLQLNDLTVAKFLIGLVLTYPFALLNPYIPFITLRHLYTAAVGIFITQYTFGTSWVHMLLSSIFGYLLLISCQNIKAMDGYRHILASTISFVYLVLRHIARTGITGSSMDGAVLQMVFTVKIYTLGYNLYDGHEDYPNLQTKYEEAVKNKNTKSIRILQDRLQRCCTTYPSLIEYFGYILNFTTVFVGPSFEYKDYLQGQTQTYGEAGYFRTRFIAGLFHILQAIICFVPVAFVKPVYPISGLVTIAADTNQSLWVRLEYLFVTFFWARTQYYAVWKLAEGSSILAGYGYRPYGICGNDSKGKLTRDMCNPVLVDCTDTLYTLFGIDIYTYLHTHYPSIVRWLGLLGATVPPLPHSIVKANGSAPDWEGATNVNPVAVETRTSVTTLVRHWNIWTQSWLERYIFLRNPFRGTLSKFVTFSMSAFWHGFRAGYYASLTAFPILDEAYRALCGLLGIQIAKNYNNPLTPIQSFSELITYILAWILSIIRWLTWMLIGGYCAAPILLLELTPIMELWGSFGYVVHIVSVSIIVFTTIMNMVTKTDSSTGTTVTEKNTMNTKEKKNK